MKFSQEKKYYKKLSENTILSDNMLLNYLILSDSMLSANISLLTINIMFSDNMFSDNTMLSADTDNALLSDSDVIR
jgi:hypothetical protein